MQLDDVRSRLSEHAAGGDLGWELSVYDDFARVTATTRDSYGTVTEALAASEELCAALLGGDLRLQHRATLSARNDHPEDSWANWVGVVEIGVADPPA